MKSRPTAGTLSPDLSRRRLGAARAVLLALAVLLPAAPAPRADAASRPAESAWISISYRDLLDPQVLTHSGVKLVDALHAKASQREIRSLLDPYTSLLGYAVQMLSGPDPAPHVSLAERYPAGSAQPGWVAILREGRYFVSSDGQGRARVFVPGVDPRDAYRRAYAVLRHPLAAALVPTPGAALQVEVYSYRNDYAAAELRLNPQPLRFLAKAFPPRARPLDLESLQAFFRQGGQLEGAELSPDEGLVLYASRTAQRVSKYSRRCSCSDASAGRAARRRASCSNCCWYGATSTPCACKSAANRRPRASQWAVVYSATAVRWLPDHWLRLL